MGAVVALRRARSSRLERPRSSIASDRSRRVTVRPGVMDDERHGGIDVRGYATMAAYLRAASPERSTDILTRHGMTKSAWQSTAGEWAQAIEEEMARGEHQRLLAYADAFRAAQRRLADDPAALE